MFLNKIYIKSIQAVRLSDITSYYWKRCFWYQCKFPLHFQWKINIKNFLLDRWFISCFIRSWPDSQKSVSFHNIVTREFRENKMIKHWSHVLQIEAFNNNNTNNNKWYENYLFKLYLLFYFCHILRKSF